MLTAEDRQPRPEDLSRDARGFRGRRWLIYNTRNADLLMVDPTASDLPQIGDPWSAQIPDLLCVDVRVIAREGTDGPLGTGGWSTFELEYQTPGYSALGDRARRVKFSEISAEDAQVTQILTLDYGTTDDGVGPGSVVIAEGRGIPRQTGTTTIRVHVPIDSVDDVDLARLIELTELNAINDAAIQIPAYRTTPAASLVTLQAGQARYRGYEWTEPDDRGRFFVVHTLAVARDHLARWTDEPVGGTPPTERSGPIYPRRDFSGLW